MDSRVHPTARLRPGLGLPTRPAPGVPSPLVPLTYRERAGNPSSCVQEPSKSRVQTVCKRIETHGWVVTLLSEWFGLRTNLTYTVRAEHTDTGSVIVSEGNYQRSLHQATERWRQLARILNEVERGQTWHPCDYRIVHY
jgi:hypothetical protein